MRTAMQESRAYADQLDQVRAPPLPPPCGRAAGRALYDTATSGACICIRVEPPWLPCLAGAGGHPGAAADAPHGPGPGRDAAPAGEGVTGGGWRGFVRGPPGAGAAAAVCCSLQRAPRRTLRPFEGCGCRRCRRPGPSRLSGRACTAAVRAPSHAPCFPSLAQELDIVQGSRLDLQRQLSTAFDQAARLQADLDVSRQQLADAEVRDAQVCALSQMQAHEQVSLGGRGTRARPQVPAMMIGAAFPPASALRRVRV